MKKERLVYIDLLRGIGVLAVYFSHLLIEGTEYGGMRFFGPYVTRVLMDWLSLSGVAVALFMLLSGFCLARSFQKHPASLGKYYYGRFTRLMIPFYLLLLAAMFLALLEDHSLASVFPGTAPLPMLFLTLLGMDGYLEVHGIATFSTVYAGEWFLGILVILNILFPLLYLAVRKHGKTIAWVLTVLFILLALSNPFGLFGADGLLPNLLIFTVGICIGAGDQEETGQTALFTSAVLVGSLLALYITGDLMGGGESAFGVMLKERLRFVKTVSTAFFLFFLFRALDPKFKRKKRPVFSFLVKYSYGIYLAHHKILLMFFSFTVPRIGLERILSSWLSSGAYILSTGVICLLISMAAAFVLENFYDWAAAPFRRKRKTGSA